MSTEHSAEVIAPALNGEPVKAAARGAAALPASAQICSCNNVSKGALCAAIDAGCTTLASLKKPPRPRQKL